MIASTEILAIQQQWQAFRGGADRLEWELGTLFIGINLVTCLLTLLSCSRWYSQKRYAKALAVEKKRPASLRSVQELELLKMGQAMTELMLASLFILTSNALCWSVLTDENTRLIQAALDNWYMLFLPWIGLFAFVLLYGHFKQLSRKVSALQ